ncbi:MAG: 2,3-bisphosphoglycerate-independent phosphoglycerate mutase [Candidatus Absconditabacteria bacterium]|nr:2,3-bisphosphoglycerate-independent phosphoglycerate mutase [Candidatus Absconditabacteria bacterium]
MEKVLLVILDGFGINTKTPEENAILQANTPTFKALFSDLYTKLDASGRAVGLPDGQMGNSEVGHMTIGTGRIIKQNLVAIDDMLDDGSFAKLSEFQLGIEHCKKNKSNLHLLQLFGPGGVHAMDSHLKKILPLIPEDINVFLHLFGDGRDLGPRSAAEYMQEFETYLQQFPNVVIASLAGRYYAMDRDNNRERVQKAYDEIMFGQLQTNDTPSEYIFKSYEKELTDEFLVPVSFMDGEQIEDGDAIFFLNFRSDRARQMTQAFVASMNPEKTKNYIDRNSRFMTKSLRNIYLSTMTKYYKEYEGNVFVKPFNIKNTLGEVISHNERKQLHVAETEKFAHVTKFFNGDKHIVYNGEKDILVPSHKVATYDLDPEMSAQEIYDEVIGNAKSYDFTVVNFANGDMVGHTGVIPAAEEAIKKLDEITKNLLDFCKKNNIHLIITADHGNCEEMGNDEKPKTAHTTNLVPFWYIKDSKIQKTKVKGGLSDIAPTILNIMKIPVPKEMTGKSLI